MSCEAALALHVMVYETQYRLSLPLPLTGDTRRSGNVEIPLKHDRSVAAGDGTAGHGTGDGSGVPLDEGVGIVTLALPQFAPTTLLQLAVAHTKMSW